MIELAYRIKNDDSVIKIVVSELERFRPEEIIAFILEKIRTLAKTKLQGDVSTAVISVPVFYGDRQKQATKDAAHSAGFEVVHLIPEPTAVALAYQFENKIDAEQERNILIYNFGRVSLDVSIINAKGNFCDLLTADFDCHLGGRDLDREIYKYVWEELRKCKKDSKLKKLRLLQLSENCKTYLSTNPRFFFTRNSSRIEQNFGIPVTRENFEEIASHIFDKAMEVVENCLKKAKLEKDGIDVIVMVGGCTRIPKVRKMVEEYFGKDKVKYLMDSNYQIARGAIVHASTLKSNKTEKIS